MSVPKVKSPLMLCPMYWEFSSHAVARKQQAIAKSSGPTGNWFEVSPTQSKDCGTRGSLAFSVPAMNSPRQILSGLFLWYPQRKRIASCAFLAASIIQVI